MGDGEFGLHDESFRTLVQTAGTAILVLSPEFKILEMNQAAERLYGCRREEEIGQSYLDRFVPPPFHEAIRTDMEQVLAGERTLGFENPVTSLSGETRQVIWNVSRLLDGSGKAVATVACGQDVTDVRAAEQEARQRNAELEAIFRAQPDRLLQLDQQNRIRLVRGPAACLGPDARRSEVGRTVRQALSDDLATKVEEVAKLVRAHDQVVTREIECDGENAPIRVEIRGVSGPESGVIVILRDITDLWRARRDLISSAARYRELVERSQDLIWSIDAESRWSFLNRGATRRILGYEPEELLHRPMSYLQPDEDPAWGLRTFRDDKEGVIAETRMRRRNGSLAILRFSGAPLRDEDGRVIGATGTASDVTLQHEAEAQQRRIDAKIQEAQRLESLGVLAGGIAHDFNNLFAGILGATELLTRRIGDDSPYREHLDIIQESSWRASELSRQMLAYAGKGRFEMRHANLSALVFDTAHLIDAAISRKARLDLQLSHEIPSVYCDVTQIRQVIMNLITNASDSLGERPGVIQLVTRQVETLPLSDGELDGNHEHGVVMLQVRDTGAGMDEATCARIFEPFFSTKFTGRGLGLAAVQGIVRAHQGMIQVQSQPGQGTCFELFLPGTDQPPEPLSREDVADDGKVGPGLVVVVDDEPALRAVAMHVLEGAGMSVITAPDGNAALEVMEREDGRVSLVLLDLAMPDLSGHETYRGIRRKHGRVPVIVTSGYHEHDILQHFADDPLVSFLQKPYRTSTLLATVRSAIARGQRAEQHHSV